MFFWGDFWQEVGGEMCVFLLGLILIKRRLGSVLVELAVVLLGEVQVFLKLGSGVLLVCSQIFRVKC